MAGRNTNEKKAMEFAKDRGHDSQSITEAFVAALDMAEWKDKQYAKENKWITVKDRLPQFVTPEDSELRYSKQVLCKDSSGHYCVARFACWQRRRFFWEDDENEVRNIKFWREIKD